jgi:hypothetical protein
MWGRLTLFFAIEAATLGVGTTSDSRGRAALVLLAGLVFTGWVLCLFQVDNKFRIAARKGMEELAGSLQVAIVAPGRVACFEP